MSRDISYIDTTALSIASVSNNLHSLAPDPPAKINVASSGYFEN